jgi:hypothetical protein
MVDRAAEVRRTRSTRRLDARKTRHGIRSVGYLGEVPTRWSSLATAAQGLGAPGIVRASAVGGRSAKAPIESRAHFPPAARPRLVDEMPERMPRPLYRGHKEFHGTYLNQWLRHGFRHPDYRRVSLGGIRYG